VGADISSRWGRFGASGAERLGAGERALDPPRRNAQIPGRLTGVVAPLRGSGFDIHLHLSRFWPDLSRYSYGPSVDFSLGGLLREMDAEGIGAGLLLQINEAPTVEANLEEGARFLSESGGRLLRSSTVDPTRSPGAVASAVAAWEKEPDLAALKLFPGYQHFFPHDPRLEPLYEFAARRKLPVLIHQGDTLDPHGLLKFTRPIDVDEVAVRFREVRFVLCHMGNPWIDECAEVVYKNENVYCDTSGLLPPQRTRYYRKAFEKAQERLRDAIVTIGSPERILYGSDWPLESISEAVALVSGLPIPPEDRTRILGTNARTLLRVEGATPRKKARNR
jgi:predicted TIM-barrel fold metal-dependent hydrolase